MKVKVRISATQELHYSETVEMEESEFNKLNALIDEDADAASELIGDAYLHTDDPCDWEPMEFDTFEIVKQEANAE